MNEKIKALVAARTAAALAKETLEAYENHDELLKSLRLAHKEAKANLSEIDTLVREAAIKMFKEDGNKSPHEDVSIKQFTTFEIDYSAATPWVKSNMPALLVVDKKAFAKYLPVAQELPDGVSKNTEPRATIASKISVEADE